MQVTPITATRISRTRSQVKLVRARVSTVEMMLPAQTTSSILLTPMLRISLLKTVSTHLANSHLMEPALRIELCALSRITHAIKVNGTSPTTPDMELASRSGQMAQCTKVTGSKTRPTVKDDSFMLMATSTRVSGRMIRLMARVSTSTLMAHSMMEIGVRISKMDMVLRLGLMVLSMRVTT